jgi:hypothetical protein
VTEDDARRKTRMKRVNGKKRWRGVVKCQQDVTRLNSVETVQAVCNERRSGATANYFDDAGRAWAKTSKKKDRRATRCRRGVGEKKNYSERLVAKRRKGAKKERTTSQPSADRKR